MRRPRQPPVVRRPGPPHAKVRPPGATLNRIPPARPSAAEAVTPPKAAEAVGPPGRAEAVGPPGRAEAVGPPGPQGRPAAEPRRPAERRWARRARGRRPCRRSALTRGPPAPSARSAAGRSLRGLFAEHAHPDQRGDPCRHEARERADARDHSRPQQALNQGTLCHGCGFKQTRPTQDRRAVPGQSRSSPRSSTWRGRAPPGRRPSNRRSSRSAPARPSRRTPERRTPG
jgi:hypothetical protein